MMTRRWCEIGAIALLVTCAAPGDEVRHEGFSLSTYASGLTLPTAMQFAPDGRLFVAQQGGEVWIVADGTVRSGPFVRVEVHDFLESGLLGLALDPGFARNRYVYLFATVSEGEQQIIRVTDRGGVGVEQTILRRFLPTSGTLHNGGCLRFGPDGMLYFSIGDVERPDDAQDLNSLAGKICRMRPDGITPDDNPFTTPTGSPRLAWALGFRNPFRFCFAPDGRMFVLDVGSDNAERQEEINIVRAGDNGGWPLVEGRPVDAQNGEFLRPVFAYHDLGSAPAGPLFYDAPNFPSEYHGNFFHTDFVSNSIFRITLAGDEVATHEVFAVAEGGPVDMTIGPDGAIYICEVITGEIKRLAYVDRGDAPSGSDDDADDVRNDAGDASDDGMDVDSVAERPTPFCGFGTPVALGLACSSLLEAKVRRRATCWKNRA